MQLARRLKCARNSCRPWWRCSPSSLGIARCAPDSCPPRYRCSSWSGCSWLVGEAALCRVSWRWPARRHPRPQQVECAAPFLRRWRDVGYAFFKAQMSWCALFKAQTSLLLRPFQGAGKVVVTPRAPGRRRRRCIAPAARRAQSSGRQVERDLRLPWSERRFGRRRVVQLARSSLFGTRAGVRAAWNCRALLRGPACVVVWMRNTFRTLWLTMWCCPA